MIHKVNDHKHISVPFSHLRNSRVNTQEMIGSKMRIMSIDV